MPWISNAVPPPTPPSPKEIPVTDSNKTLDRNIAHAERMLALALAKNQEWTAEKFREQLVWLRAQRSKPRAARFPYTVGTL